MAKKNNKKQETDFSLLGYLFATGCGAGTTMLGNLLASQVKFFQSGAGQIMKDSALYFIGMGVGWLSNGKRNDVAYGIAGATGGHYGDALSAKLGMNGLLVNPVVQGFRNRVSSINGNVEMDALAEHFDSMGNYAPSPVQVMSKPM